MTPFYVCATTDLAIVSSRKFRSSALAKIRIMITLLSIRLVDRWRWSTSADDTATRLVVCLLAYLFGVLLLRIRLITHRFVLTSASHLCDVHCCQPEPIYFQF